MGMKKIYEFILWISLFLMVVVSIVFHNSKVKLEVENEKNIEICEKRIASLLTSNSIENRKIIPLSVQNILTDNKKCILFADTTILVLLSKPQCNKCQEKELYRLIEFGSKEDIKIIGITTKSNMVLVAIQKKLNRFDFPVFTVDEGIFYTNLAFDDEFPQILYIVNGIVHSAFKPIPMDDEFSDNYYKYLLNKIKREL